MALIPAISGLDQRKYNILIVLVLQLIMFGLFVGFVRYADKVYPQEGVDDHDSIERIYPKFLDTHVMVFVGFGFLMTFMKRYMFGGVAFNFVLAGLMLQWSILIDGFFYLDDNYKIQVNIITILEADIATAAVLISMGAVLGRTTFLQLLFMGILELIFQSVTYYLNFRWFQASDCGCAILIHAFGAYFGLAVSLVLNLRSKYKPDPEDMASSYNSDTFAMIGTLFLWIYWPSFNAAEDIEDKQARAEINTYLSLAACVVTTFFMSWLVTKENKFDMVHIQNSTLAGGVAVGAVANLVLEPWGAILIGMSAAVLSVSGYRYLTPCLERINITDTCGVHNLHGMPGVLSGLISIVIAATATEGLYRSSLYYHYPARAPSSLTGDDNISININPGENRSNWGQASFQALALVSTLGIAIIGGLITGLVISTKLFDYGAKDVKKHHDQSFWTIHDKTVTPDLQSVSHVA